MAHLIPPYGPNCALVLTRDEAVATLQTLNSNATYENRPVREALAEYIERQPDENHENVRP